MSRTSLLPFFCKHDKLTYFKHVLLAQSSHVSCSKNPMIYSFTAPSIFSWHHSRQRIEERLKLDEKHRQEEKRAQHHLVKLDQKIVKLDQKIVKLDQKNLPKDGSDPNKVFGKPHDPTTSYLSTYMPKPNQVNFIHS